MALIKCPECGNTISDKAEKCPQCGLPAEYFHARKKETQEEVDYRNLGNILISFGTDYSRLFSRNRYITSRDRMSFIEMYGAYFLVLPYTKKDFVSHRVPDSVYSRSGHMEVNSKKLCRILAEQHGWDVTRSYRVPGVIVLEKKLAAFDLTKAEPISA